MPCAPFAKPNTSVSTPHSRRLKGGDGGPRNRAQNGGTGTSSAVTARPSEQS